MQLSSMVSSVFVIAYTHPSTECSGLNSTLGNPPASPDVPGRGRQREAKKYAWKIDKGRKANKMIKKAALS